MKRRSFIRNTALGLAAAAIVPRTVLAKQHVLYGDGVRDDTEAFQAMVDGKDVYLADGSRWEGHSGLVRLPIGQFKITKEINW